MCRGNPSSIIRTPVCAHCPPSSSPFDCIPFMPIPRCIIWSHLFFLLAENSQPLQPSLPLPRSWRTMALLWRRVGLPTPFFFFFRFLAFSLLPNRWLKLLQRSRLPLWKSKMNQEGGPCRRPRSSPNLPLWILSFVYFSTYLAGSNRFVLWGCFLSINKSRSRFCWGRRRTSTSWWPRRRRRGKLERARSRAEELWGALRDLFSVSPCSLQFFPPFFNWWYFY